MRHAHQAARAVLRSVPRETLRLAWTDPQALDPARRSARVTREIAQSLGLLVASLEESGHSAEAVATFLMRAQFTMFAEDVELLPKDNLCYARI